jgi:hypothetical protein
MWNDMVFLAVFLAFLTGTAFLLSPILPMKVDSSNIAQSGATLVLIGALLLGLVLGAVLRPIEGGIVLVITYALLTLWSVIRDHNIVTLIFWCFWLWFALFGSYQKLRDLRMGRMNWSAPQRPRDGATPVQVFFLTRLEDVSGVSGTGRVAEGAVFSNGRVALVWISAPSIPTMTFYDSIEDVERIHGHEGRTVIEWQNADIVVMKAPR